MAARVSIFLKSRASPTCFRACFLPGRATDLSAPRYYRMENREILFRFLTVTDFFFPHIRDTSPWADSADLKNLSAQLNAGKILSLDFNE